MSKDAKVQEVVEEKVKNNGPIESNDKAKEVIDSLRVHLQEHLRQTEHHRTMATKAQGALEVLLQLHPEEENSEG